MQYQYVTNFNNKPYVLQLIASNQKADRNVIQNIALYSNTFFMLDILKYYYIRIYFEGKHVQCCSTS